MARNLYFSDAVRSEQELYENIIIESLKMYGQDVYYLPRDLVNEDKILGDDVASKFNSSYKVEMYIENVDGFDGDGDLFTKFGVEIRDQATFVVARRRWSDTVTRYDNEITGNRPREGDLIYLPMSKSMFQIMAVEHEQPFYQLRDLPTYKLRAELFEYTSEEFDTDITDIDAIERDFAYQYEVRFTQSTALADVGISNNTAEIVNILDGGENYPSVPTVSFSNGPVIHPVKFGNDYLAYGGANSLYPATTNTDRNMTSFTESYLSNTSRGSLDFWIYVNNLPTGDDLAQLVVTGLEEDKGDTNVITKTLIGLNSAGRLTNGEFYTGQDTLALSNIDGGPVITENAWHHVRISLRGPLTGTTTRVLQAYIDGELVHRDDLISEGTFSGNFTVGGSTVAGVDGIIDSFNIVDAYIDDFHVNNTQPNILDTVNIPTEPYTGNELGTIAYETFDTPTLQGTASVVNGVVTQIALDNDYNHDYFVNPPSVTLSSPTSLEFKVGELIQQTLSNGVLLNAKIGAWKKSTGTMTLQQVGANDGYYHEVSTSATITGYDSLVSAVPSTVTEVNTMSNNEQNDDFESEADDILDFSETNPFGDPNEA